MIFASSPLRRSRYCSLARSRQAEKENLQFNADQVGRPASSAVTFAVGGLRSRPGSARFMLELRFLLHSRRKIMLLTLHARVVHVMLVKSEILAPDKASSLRFAESKRLSFIDVYRRTTFSAIRPRPQADQLGDAESGTRHDARA